MAVVENSGPSPQVCFAVASLRRQHATDQELIRKLNAKITQLEQQLRNEKPEASITHSRRKGKSEISELHLTEGLLFTDPSVLVARDPSRPWVFRRLAQSMPIVQLCEKSGISGLEKYILQQVPSEKTYWVCCEPNPAKRTEGGSAHVRMKFPEIIAR
eukprot:c23469_g1_i1.p1 GENE.c23469_g1_i1~~c23469_g1_i1.p1  ORF type:complete len:170 (+),score=40.69 c23469_g1_i1:38-511(+)